MLTVTDNAQAAVKGLTADQTLPESAGLRLSLADDPGKLEVAVVSQPQPTDQVVAGSDANVYVAEDCAEVLEDQTLDAGQTADGIGFSLVPQHAG
ncbi:Fe-S cluster assembly protein HesB [Ornithinimicrobium tianjinense]|uniref:Fe-S cluster assembly iron-binding protein IscA n=1 Tax=Ornithinimicrobium tianjinense TaxID=1195761 RepID=A0A917BUQ7_9MICO|nr:Fe-S cluster assembly protein HesB [Ornithinimicrobium tianjinense]GGF56622.1 hypothetical protein GCM10011366_25590 [Ornithinimicrobium tianjinense]